MKTVNAISVGVSHLVLAGVDLNLQVHILKRVYILDFLREISRNLELSEIERFVGVFIETTTPSAIHARTGLL